MAFNDLSNSPSISTSSPTTLKRERVSDTQDDLLLPSKLKAKRRFPPSISSSSSSPAPSCSSPFAFRDTRFDAYDAPSSPIPSSFSAPPSSPCLKPLAVTRFSSPDYLEPPASSENNNNNTTAFPFLIPININSATFLQFGRKAKKPTKNTPQTTLAIRLPATAKNASRIHCTAKLIDHKEFEINVLGMNGMKIDGKTWKIGSLVKIAVVQGQKIMLGFWGWEATLVLGGEQKEVTTSALPMIVIESSTPASSAYGSRFADEEPEDEREEQEMLVDPTPQRSVSPAESELSALSPSSPASRRVPFSDPTSPAQALVESLSLDLASAIATAIVFQPRATVGVGEVVRALLHEVGGMWDVLRGGKPPAEADQRLVNKREEMAVEAWWDVVEGVLRREKFFGCIENEGLRDAAGTPLLPVFYYLSELDPVASRVEALEPFVKRVRGARTSGGGKRYFWRKPSLKKNR